jgi:hypothetical protein
VVTCTPRCETLWVDGHPVPVTPEGSLFVPGVHMVGVGSKARGTWKAQAVLLRGGEVHHLDVKLPAR